MEFFVAQYCAPPPPTSRYCCCNENHDNDHDNNDDDNDHGNNDDDDNDDDNDHDDDAFIFYVFQRQPSLAATKIIISACLTNNGKPVSQVINKKGLMACLGIRDGQTH